MKIEIQPTNGENIIADINFHGASFAAPEKKFGSIENGLLTVDSYAGGVIAIGITGDKSSAKWFVVANGEAIQVESKDAATDVFFHAARYRCTANREVADPLFTGSEQVDALVSSEILKFLCK